MLAIISSFAAFAQENVIGKFYFSDKTTSAKIDIDWDREMDVEVYTANTKVEYDGRWEAVGNVINFIAYEKETTTYNTFKRERKQYGNFMFTLTFTFNTDGSIDIVSSDPSQIPSGKYMRGF